MTQSHWHIRRNRGHHTEANTLSVENVNHHPNGAGSVPYAVAGARAECSERAGRALSIESLRAAHRRKPQLSAREVFNKQYEIFKEIVVPLIVSISLRRVKLHCALTM